MVEHQAIINKSGMEITAVTEVDAFSEREIKLSLDGGDKLIVCGENLKINAFSKQSSSFSLLGRVHSLKYAKAGEKLINKFFK